MPPPLQITYIVMKYPTLSQTFIEREMLGLAGQGLKVEVHPCLDFRRPEAVEAPIPVALTVVRPESRWRLLRAAAREAWQILRHRRALAWAALWTLFRHLPRHGEGWFMTLWGTIFGLARAEEFRRRTDIAVIHGAWATAPATAAAVLGALCERPYSFGAHAYDLHRHGGDPLLPVKMATARFVHTTTWANAEMLRARYPQRRAEVVLVRRGLPGKLPPIPERTPPGMRRDKAVRILSVGRLVEKKGHNFQIEACDELMRRGWEEFQLKIIGDGPLLSALKLQIGATRLGKRVELAGALPPAEVRAAYEWADIFWHTGIVDSQGDRDGLPNVIPEAFAHALPVISSAAGGATEAVIDKETGLIVDPRETARLADAVQRLARDETLRTRLGMAGRRWVEENFLVEDNAKKLAEAFEKAGR